MNTSGAGGWAIRSAEVEADGQERPAWTLVSGQAQAGSLLLTGPYGQLLQPKEPRSGARTAHPPAPEVGTQHQPPKERLFSRKRQRTTGKHKQATC